MTDLSRFVTKVNPHKGVRSARERMDCYLELLAEDSGTDVGKLGWAVNQYLGGLGLMEVSSCLTPGILAAINDLPAGMCPVSLLTERWHGSSSGAGFTLMAVSQYISKRLNKHSYYLGELYGVTVGVGLVARKFSGNLTLMRRETKFITPEMAQRLWRGLALGAKLAVIPDSEIEAEAAKIPLYTVPGEHGFPPLAE